MGWGQGRAWPLLSGERGHYELAAGRDVTPFITAMEKFSSTGGMLPEQVWDYDDVPEEEMFQGQVGGVGATAGVGALGVSEAAAERGGWARCSTAFRR